MVQSEKGGESVKRGSMVLVIGIILLLSSLALLLFLSSTTEMNMKMITLEKNATNEINYTLQKGNYTLVIQSSEKIHYQLFNSSGIIEEGNVSAQTTIFLSSLQGDYTLKIRNIGNSTADVIIFFENDTKISSLSMIVLSSGGMCLAGIIVIIVGVIFIYKERRRNENVY